MDKYTLEEKVIIVKMAGLFGGLSMMKCPEIVKEAEKLYSHPYIDGVKLKEDYYSERRQGLFRNAKKTKMMDHVKAFYGKDWEQMKGRMKHYETKEDVAKYWEQEDRWLRGETKMPDEGKEIILGDDWQAYD